MVQKGGLGNRAIINFGALHLNKMRFVKSEQIYQAFYQSGAGFFGQKQGEGLKKTWLIYPGGQFEEQKISDIR